jgi:hypothetical protein
MTAAFREHPEVRQHHTDGLTLAVTATAPQEFDAARNKFGHALTVLMMTDHDLLPADVIMQNSRIRRDMGFTWAREALVAGDPSLLWKQAFPLLDKADIALGELLAQQRSGRLCGGKEVYQLLEAEIGATKGVIGRVAVLGAILETGMPKLDPSGYFKRAHVHLKHGSNKYYQTSNAMHAARYERMRGQPVRTALWVGKALSSVIRAVATDRNNAKAAVRTFVGRLPHLKDQYSAAKAIRAKP